MHRDRAIVLGGLRAGEVRSLRLADVDMGLRRVRVVGKGNRERVVPVDGARLGDRPKRTTAVPPVGWLSESLLR